MYFFIENEKDDEKFASLHESATDARHWIINTLDLSKNWEILTQKEYGKKYGVGFVWVKGELVSTL
jgi:hypothetical protein